MHKTSDTLIFEEKLMNYVLFNFQKCLKFVTGAECCEFTCLDDPKDKLKKNNSSSLNDTNSKVSLLLVTAFLFLSYHHFIRHVLN